MRKIVDHTQTLFNNGLANVRMQTEQISATENTVKKLIQENELEVEGLRRSIKEMSELTKMKEMHNDVIFEQMKTEVQTLKQTAEKLETKLSHRISQEVAVEDELVKKFEELNNLAAILEKESK